MQSKKKVYIQRYIIFFFFQIKKSFVHLLKQSQLKMFKDKIGYKKNTYTVVCKPFSVTVCRL